MSRTVNMPALAYIISTQHFLLRYFYLQISRYLVLMVLRTVSACDILQNRAPRREQCHIICGCRACLAANAAGMLFFTRVASSLQTFFFFYSSGASRVLLKWRQVRRVGSPEAEWRPGAGHSTVCSLRGWRIPSTTNFSSLHFFLYFIMWIICAFNMARLRRWRKELLVPFQCFASTIVGENHCIWVVHKSHVYVVISNTLKLHDWLTCKWVPVHALTHWEIVNGRGVTLHVCLPKQQR